MPSKNCSRGHSDFLFFFFFFFIENSGDISCELSATEDQADDSHEMTRLILYEKHKKVRNVSVPWPEKFKCKLLTPEKLKKQIANARTQTEMGGWIDGWIDG